MSFIVLEGVSGSGKTEISKLFEKEEYNVFYRETGNEYFKNKKTELRNGLDEIIEDANYFLKEMRESFSEKYKAPKGGKNIINVADRWFYSIEIYQFSKVKIEDQFKFNPIKSEISEKLIEPDYTIILDCDHKAASSRKGVRFEEEAFSKQRNMYRDLHDKIKSCFIPTDRKTPEETLEEIKKILKLKGIRND